MPLSDEDIQRITDAVWGREVYDTNGPVVASLALSRTNRNARMTALRLDDIEELDDEELDLIAQEVNDERDRRDRERLDHPV